MANNTSFNIRVSVQITDASIGKAYMFATPVSDNANVSTIMTHLENKSLTETNMILLGTFEGKNAVNNLSGNIDTAISIVSSPFSTSSLLDNEEYDVFVYAVDHYNNRAVQKHPQSPVKMMSNTIVINWTNLFIGDVDANKFAEHRNFDVPNPMINLTGNVFDFSRHSSGEANKLYINGNVDVSEFVVDSVDVVVTESQKTDIEVHALLNKIRVMGNFSNFNQIVVDQTNEVTPSNIEFGKDYYVYSIINDHGLLKKYVKLVTTVTTGTVPVLQDVTVKIDEI